ncbi:MAG TPA: hypothetical protein VF712_00055 [Thermoleophilaceae bacterium]
MSKGNGTPEPFSREQVKAVQGLASRGEPQRLVALLALLGRQEPTDRALAQLAALLRRANVVAEPRIETLNSNLAEVELAFASRWRRLWAKKVVRAGWSSALKVAAVLNVVAAIIAISAVVIHSGSPKMDGDLTVAVAPFTVAGGDSEIGADVARAAETTLRQRFRELEKAVPVDAAPLRTDTRGPGDVEPVADMGAAKRAEHAERIAEELGADIVIYGSIRFARGRTHLATELFVRSRALPDAPELSGAFPVSAGVTFRVGQDGRAVRALLAGSVIEEARWVGALSLGLGWYQLRRLPEAKSYLRLAQRSARARSPAAIALLELISANIAGVDGDLAAADQAYRRSLTAVPGNARATFGLAEIAYQRARGRCERGRIQPAGIRTALRRFSAAANRSSDPTVRARARLGEAKALTCLSEAGMEDRYADAQRALDVVIEAFNRGDDRLQEEASEAHGLRGLIYLVPRLGTDRDGRLRRAASEYQTAKTLALTDQRESVLSAQRSHVLALLGDVRSARKEYAHAMELDAEIATRIGPPREASPRMTP